jgi:hypothetical protein
MSTRWHAALLAAAVLLQVGLSVQAMRGNSATFDEGAHLPAGYTHLVLSDHRLNPEQPPLVKLLAALPLLAVHPVVRLDDRAWILGRQWEFGQRFLYRWNDADRLLFLGRLPIVALACLLLVVVFFEARRRFSPVAAATAVFLAALSPDVLAHGALVTTDMGFALFFFLTVVAFARLVERATLRRLLATGLAAGCAFATKFSGPLLVPTLLLLGLVVSLDAGPIETALGRPARPVTGSGPRLRHVAGLLLATFALALVCVWGSYGFHYALSPVPSVRAAERAVLERPVTGPAQGVAVALARAHLVPEDYARGLLFVLTHSEARPTFLLGHLSDHGFPQYFLVSFLLKSPVPLILLTLLAAGRAIRLPRRDALFLWLPVIVYLAFTATRGLQIGHRHLLPIYPFLFVAAGEVVAHLLSRRRTLGVVAALVLGGWYAGGTLRTHPHYLAYFNEIGGGPANGFRLLVDSNLDWGQDLKRLAAWVRENDVERLKLSYFGSALPAYYGIDSEALPGYTAPHVTHVTREVRPGDVAAISATNLQGVYLAPEDRRLMERFRRLAPIGRAGYSILVYRADFSWPERAASSEER